MRGLWFILVWLALAVPAAAQLGPPPGAQAEAAIAKARAELHALAGPAGKTLSDDEIESRRAAIPPIQAELAQALATVTPRLQDLQARQTQLGPAPAAGAPPEDPRTAQMRRDLTRAVVSLTGDVQDARVLMLAADQLSSALSDRLRENFSTRLWTRTRSILDPGLWRDFARAAPGDATRLARAIAEETDKAAPLGKPAQSIGLAVAAAVLGLFLLGPGRLILIRFGYRRAARGDERARIRRTALGVWLVLAAAVTPLLAGVLLRAVLIEVNLMTPDVDRLTVLLIRVSVFAAVLEGLGRALLSPARPAWRLAPVPDDVARRLAPFPGLAGGAAALAAFVSGFNTILGSSLASRLALDSLTIAVELAVVIGALSAVGRARVERRAADAAREEAAPAAETQSRLPWVLATLAAWAAVAAALVALLVGYLALAGFLMRETVWIATVLALLSILLRLADDLFPSLLAAEAPFGRALDSALGLSRGTMDQLGVLLSGLTRLVLLLLAWAAVLVPFGAGAEDIFHRFTATDFVVRLGLVSISPGAVLGAIALFLAGVAITRAIRRWLEVRYLPKTALDLGVRTSLAAGVSYLGAFVALLVAFAYLGLSVAQIALFASALSVGIGFGLQSIISNFVSGLILLAERPVRVGDWIAIGEVEGDVRKISIRATEIDLPDRSRLIVPNSDLVSKTVRNITHTDALGRVKIVLKVDDAADPAAVRETIQGCLKAHKRVLKTPEAGVYLTDVRDGTLEFTAFAYVASPRLAYGVKSELLFALVPALKAAGVALAAAGPVVRLGLAERMIEPQAGET